MFGGSGAAQSRGRGRGGGSLRLHGGLAGGSALGTANTPRECRLDNPRASKAPQAAAAAGATKPRQRRFCRRSLAIIARPPLSVLLGLRAEASPTVSSGGGGCGTGQGAAAAKRVRVGVVGGVDGATAAARESDLGMDGRSSHDRTQEDTHKNR
eukprot:g7715.t1